MGNACSCAGSGFKDHRKAAKHHEASIKPRICLALAGALHRIIHQAHASEPLLNSHRSRNRLQQATWKLQDLLDSLSGHGWVLRLQHIEQLEGLCASHLQAVVETGVDITQHATAMSDGYTELAQLAEALQEAPNLRQIAAQRNKQGQHSFAQLLLPHVHRYAGESQQQVAAEVQWEVSQAVCQLTPGPHQAIRHPDLRVFWWMHDLAEEVNWGTFWRELLAFVADHGTRCTQLGGPQLVQELVGAADIQAYLQNSINSMGYQEHVTPAELDLAVFEHLSLLDSLVFLLRYKQAHLLRDAHGLGTQQSVTPYLAQDLMPTLKPGKGSSAQTVEHHANGHAVQEEGAARTLLMGRDEQLEALTAQLQGQATRLLILHGPQGAGKSALAQVLCQELVARQHWSVYTRVDARGASTPDELACALCTALRVPHYPVALPAARRLRQHVQRVGRQLLRQGVLIEDMDASLAVAASGLLSQSLAHAPGLQVCLTSASVSPAQQAAALDARILPRELGQPTIVVQEVRPLSEAASCALLAMHAGPSLLSSDHASTISQACMYLPSLLRLAGCALCQGAVEPSTLASISAAALQGSTSAAAPASQQGAGSGGDTAAHQPVHPSQAAVLLKQSLVQHLLPLLSPLQRAAFYMLCLIQVPLSQSSAEALLGSLLGHHPCGVRDALCTLYDLGLIHFHEQPQVHEVDAGVCSVVLAQAPDVEQAAACIQSLLHSCDEYLQECSTLMLAGYRQAAMHRYSHSQPLIQQGVQVSGTWLLKNAPNGPAAAAYLLLLARHLNTQLGRLVFAPSLHARLGCLLSQLAASQQDPNIRAQALLVGARALAHSREGAAQQQAQALVSEASALARSLAAKGKQSGPALPPGIAAGRHFSAPASDRDDQLRSLVPGSTLWSGAPAASTSAGTVVLPFSCEESVLITRAELAHASGDAAMAAMLLDNLPRDIPATAASSPQASTSATGSRQDGPGTAPPQHQQGSTSSAPLNNLSAEGERQLELALVEMWQGDLLQCLASSGRESKLPPDPDQPSGSGSSSSRAGGSGSQPSGSHHHPGLQNGTAAAVAGLATTAAAYAGCVAYTRAHSRLCAVLGHEHWLSARAWSRATISSLLHHELSGTAAPGSDRAAAMQAETPTLQVESDNFTSSGPHLSNPPQDSGMASSSTWVQKLLPSSLFGPRQSHQQQQRQQAGAKEQQLSEDAIQEATSPAGVLHQCLALTARSQGSFNEDSAACLTALGSLHLDEAQAATRAVPQAPATGTSPPSPPAAALKSVDCTLSSLCILLELWGEQEPQVLEALAQLAAAVELLSPPAARNLTAHLLTLVRSSGPATKSTQPSGTDTTTILTTTLRQFFPAAGSQPAPGKPSSALPTPASPHTTQVVDSTTPSAAPALQVSHSTAAALQPPPPLVSSQPGMMPPALVPAAASDTSKLSSASVHLSAGSSTGIGRHRSTAAAAAAAAEVGSSTPPASSEAGVSRGSEGVTSLVTRLASRLTQRASLSPNGEAQEGGAGGSGSGSKVKDAPAESGHVTRHRHTSSLGNAFEPMPFPTDAMLLSANPLYSPMPSMQRQPGAAAHHMVWEEGECEAQGTAAARPSHESQPETGPSF